MRRQLALVAITVASLVVVAALFPVATLVRNQARDQAISAAETDAQSIAAALAVAASTEPETGVTVDLAEAVLQAFQSREGVSIIFPDGTARGVPFPDSANIDRARAGDAVTSSTPGGAEVLVPVLVADAPTQDASVVVRAAIPQAELQEGVVRAWLLLGALGVLLVVVAALVTDWMGRSLVRPVTALSDAARSLAEGDLDARVAPTGPQEVAEVGEAFNLLANRLETLLREERESVADLSHRLRTPLTALRLQAETLSDRGDSSGLIADVDKLERAVDRMIQELRRPSSDGAAEAPVADLAAIVRHRSTFWKVLADDQDRPVEVSTRGGRLPVPLSPDELGAVVDTLIENVFAHTDPGTAYHIIARPGVDQTAVLIVEDAGSGFDEMELVERGRSGGGSTGLGLDIVRRAAERTGGSFNVSNGPRGGRVEVVFGTTR